MTSMMMLEITKEVSVNNDLPLKGRAQAWLGHPDPPLPLFGLSLTLGHILDLVKL